MEQRVGRLEVEMGALSQRMKAVEEWVPESRTFHRDMDLFKATLIAQQEAMRDEQTRRHHSNATKLNIISACIAIGTAIIMAIGIIVSVWVSKHAEITPEKILHSQHEPEMAHNYLATE